MNINAALRRHLPAGILDLSSAGALLESHDLHRVGVIGLLDVELGGVRYVEWFRVARVDRCPEAGAPYRIGVEFLQLALAGDDSLRGAMRRQVHADATAHTAHRRKVVWKYRNICVPLGPPPGDQPA